VTRITVLTNCDTVQNSQINAAIALPEIKKFSAAVGKYPRVSKAEWNMKITSGATVSILRSFVVRSSMYVEIE
jgi:hypothetical protein